jgi:hypothetical protein
MSARPSRSVQAAVKLGEPTRAASALLDAVEAGWLEPGLVQAFLDALGGGGPMRW